MAFLNRTKKTAASSEEVIPSGSFTVDRNGRILTSTIRSGVPVEKLTLVARVVLDILHRAQESPVPAEEISVRFSSMNLEARDLRGGAIIFLTPAKAVKS